MLDSLSTDTHSSDATGSLSCEVISQFLFLSLESIETFERLKMPAFINNCLFIPSDRLPALRQRIFLTIKISDSNTEAAVIGKVVWLNSTPRGIQGINKMGFGIQFESGSEELENLIERAGDSRSGA